MLNIINNITELKDLIAAKAFHPYLHKKIEEPYIDDDKLLLLWGLFNELEISNDERNHYMLSTMLVQIALDTHENVSNTQLEAHEAELIRNRQLVVLAGDYFSGLYYQVLAEVGNVGMIRTLSSGVKRINDHKIILYQQSFDNTSSFVNSLKAVEASLIFQLADYFQKPNWQNVAENLLLVKRLLLEQEKYKNNKPSLLYEAAHSILFPEYEAGSVLSNEQVKQVQNTMNACIEYAVESLKEAKETIFPDSKLHERINELLDRSGFGIDSYVKEG